jgi:hypothetical protein
VVAHRSGAGRCYGGDGWVICGRGPAGAGDGASPSVPWLRIVAALAGAIIGRVVLERGVRGEWTGGSGGWGFARPPAASGRVAALRKCCRASPSPAGLRPLFV